MRAKRRTPRRDSQQGKRTFTLRRRDRPDLTHRLNRPAGLVAGAIGVSAGVLALLARTEGVVVVAPLAVAGISLLCGGTWLVALGLQARRDVRQAGRSRLRLERAVIGWSVLAAFVLSVIASALFAVQDGYSEWAHVMALLAFATIAPVAILTALMISILAQQLFSRRRASE